MSKPLIPPSQSDWERLDETLAHKRWADNQAKASIQEATRALDRVSRWSHPLLWIKLYYERYRLQRALGDEHPEEPA